MEQPLGQQLRPIVLQGKPGDSPGYVLAVREAEAMATTLLAFCRLELAGAFLVLDVPISFRE